MSRRARSTPTRTPVAEHDDERCGSGQSAASLAKDIAAQPALLAAARTPVKATKRAGILKTSPKKVFVFKKPAVNAGNHGKAKEKKAAGAVVKFVRAKYQKGDKIHQLSGNVYWQGRPRYANNDIFKEKVSKKLLMEVMRWNTELKTYRAKIYSAKQAKMIRDAMKAVSADDEEDLETNGPTDEDIDQVFDFEEYKPAEISIILEFELDGEMTKAIGGMTFPWKDILQEIGFTFSYRTKMYHAPVDTDTDEIEALFDEYGFDVETFEEMAAAEE